MWKIFRAVQEKGKWRMTYSEQLYQLYKSPNIITIKVSRLKLAGHVKRMDENEFARRIMECKHKGVIRRAQPKLRRNEVSEDLSKIGVK